MRAGRGVGGQQVAEDGVRDEVEGVPGDVPEDHGPGPPVQPLEALGLQDAADAVDGTSVEPLARDVDGAQRDVGARGNVGGEVEVLWKHHQTQRYPNPFTLFRQIWTEPDETI